MTEICPSCGHPLPADAPACRHCGVPVLEPPPWDDIAPLSTSTTFRGQLPAYQGPEDPQYAPQGQYDGALSPGALPHVSSIPAPLDLMPIPQPQRVPSLPSPRSIPPPVPGGLPAATTRSGPGQRPHRPHQPHGAHQPPHGRPSGVDTEQPLAGHGSEEPLPEPLDPLAPIHQFGPTPESALYCLPYFVRVYVRRRVLTDELSSLVQERRQAEARVDELHYRIGETLFVRRTDPRLSALSRHFQVVAQADNQVDARVSMSDDARRTAVTELETIQARIEAAKQAAEPVRRREAQLLATEAKLTGQLHAAQSTLRDVEQQVKRLTAAGPSGPKHVELLASQAQRQAQEHALAEKVQAVASELARTRSRISRVEAAIQAERATYEAKNVALSRQSVRLTVATGSARESLERALRSLAESAIQQGLIFLVESQLEKLRSARENASQKQQREAQQREAMGAYDAESYELGQKLLVGGTTALFLTLVYLVFL